MHTMVVRMSVDPARTGEVARHLREDVTGWAKQQPGFVSGQWLGRDGGTEALGVVVFASEADAARAAQGPRRNPPDAARAWNIENVTVFEQLASA
ncbi:MAG TPA: antibiotic biosynthesis monooxygenase [Streptosporangiaceae bacterium]|jgi:hypothetical protein